MEKKMPFSIGSKRKIKDEQINSNKKNICEKTHNFPHKKADFCVIGSSKNLKLISWYFLRC